MDARGRHVQLADVRLLKRVLILRNGLALLRRSSFLISSYRRRRFPNKGLPSAPRADFSGPSAICAPTLHTQAISALPRLQLAPVATLEVPIIQRVLLLIVPLLCDLLLRFDWLLRPKNKVNN